MVSHARWLAVIVAAALIGLPGSAVARQAQCLAPSPSCSLSADVTTTQIEIGGSGSVAGSSRSSPATCGPGPNNVVGARLDFSFIRSTGQLTVVAINNTISPNAGALTGFAFNTGNAVTYASLVSEDDPNHVWVMGFDRVRTDGMIENPTGTSRPDLSITGFGRLSAFAGNNGLNTGPGGGNITSIAPGRSVTFVFELQGDLANVTACSFTSVGTLIRPGDKTVLAAGRFQGCSGGADAWVGPCAPTGLPVRLVDFRVEGRRHDRITWETGSEIDAAGFHVLVLDERTRQYRRVNEALIPGRGTETSGAVYSLVDAAAINGKRLRYSLEEIGLDGDNVIHEDLARVVVINPVDPEIRLVMPAYEEAVSANDGVRFRWEAGRFGRRLTLEVSSDAAFPEAGTMTIGSGSTRTRSLSRRELGTLEEMAALSGEGGVYWRVRGLDASGRQGTSPTYFMVVR